MTNNIKDNAARHHFNESWWAGYGLWASLVHAAVMTKHLGLDVLDLEMSKPIDLPRLPAMHTGLLRSAPPPHDYEMELRAGYRTIAQRTIEGYRAQQHISCGEGYTIEVRS